MKKTSKVKKIYDSKAFWVIVSLLVSLTFWVYVTSVESDVFKQTFRGVPVDIVNEDILRNSKNLVVTDLDTNTVTLEVIGPRRIVGALDATDIVAQVDVSKLSQPAYTSQQLYISFPDGIDPSSVEIVKTTPSSVNFFVSKLATKEIPVRGGFEGDIAEGYTAEVPVFEPSTITVTGPENHIKNISYAWVTFGQDVVVDKTYSVDTSFSLMTENGEKTFDSSIETSVDTITAKLPILEIKDVILSVDIIEGAGATSANTKIKIEPESITLAGDSAILAGVNKIVLGTIDLRDFASTFSETYTIALDNELVNLTGVTEAKVTVEIVGLETQTFKVRNFSCTNVTEGYTAEIKSTSIDVKIRGTAEQLEKIESANIRAVADLTDYLETTGKHMPLVKIYVDGFTDVGAIEEYTISVEIRKA